MWIEIFKGGPQRDSQGREHDGDCLIEKAVSSFNAGEHRPPLVLGHPKDDSPAYGWVNGVKADVASGVKRLMADIAPVDALKGWVNGRLYQNRSAAFYADGRLRHVGFLGGTPPAVKGLTPLPAFGEDADTSIEFISHHTKASTKGDSMKFSEFLNAINIFKKLGGKDEDIDMIAPPSTATPSVSAGTFTEADLEAAKQKAAEDARKEAEAKFAETEAKRRKAQRTEKIGEYIDAGVETGKIAPAWVDAGIGLFMEQLATDSPIEFCEGKEKKTTDAWFKEFLEGLPKLINFEEIASRDKDAGAGTNQEKREQLISEFMEKNQGVTYKDAVLSVSEKHPDLFKDR